MPQWNTVSEPGEQAYEVGHGKPPVETRWGPGQSGNPKGRPKGSSSTARKLARAKRSASVDALVAIAKRAHDPGAKADVLREAREAISLLLRYSDGEPGAANVPTDLEEHRASAAEDDVDTAPPVLGEEVAA